MQSKIKLFQRKQSLPEFYDSLDAPVYVWEKVHESSDLSWLLVKRDAGIKITKQLLSVLQDALEKIYNEYISEFGLSEEFVSIKQKQISIALKKCELIITGDRSLKTFIAVEELELQEMKKEIGKSSFMESKIAIENKFKFQLNMHTTTIREFHSYLKHLK